MTDPLYTPFVNDLDGRAEMASNGFASGIESTDGSIIVGTRKSTEVYNAVNLAVKPSYWAGNWPSLTHLEAMQLVSIQASADGASDGYIYDPSLGV